MIPVLYTLTSSLHAEAVRQVQQEPFITAIEDAMGCHFDVRGNDFSTYGQHPCDIIYVRTGGTEGLFLDELSRNGILCVPSKVRLLTSGKSNSLAASMEILSYLNENGVAGEILHGTPEYIAERIMNASDAEDAPDLTVQADFSGALDGQRFGVIGHPSDWLISSDVDYSTVREVLGAELVDVPMGELLDEIEKARERRSEGVAYFSPESLGLPGLNPPKFGNPIPSADLSDSICIYAALRRIIDKYQLNGLTLRCFDLLTAVHNTGCMSLAILNSEGYVATCEGDVPAMLSMAIVRKVAGVSGFQCNLSEINGDNLLFAHCTVPLNMVRNWVYDTHFESGFGVAIHGEIPEGPATIFKLGPDCRTAFIREVEIVRNSYEGNLCRTQIVVNAPNAASYFLRQPIGNHHIVFPGHFIR